MPVNAADAQFVRDLVRRKSAISLDATKDYLIETRLDELARKEGIAGLPQLVERARKGELQLHTAIVEAITTHETSFYRDNRPFELLKNDVLPPILASRKGSKSLTIWSAACSSGQEPYSLAMLLLEHFPELADWNIKIIATDISEQVIAKAREGSFTQLEVNRGLPVALLLKYFERVHMRYRVKDSLRKLVEFRQGNLLDTATLRIRPDIVFLRNVLIYFEVDVKRTILDNVRSLIAPDGVLFLGAAETATGIAEGWSSVIKDHSTYFKVQR